MSTITMNKLNKENIKLRTELESYRDTEYINKMFDTGFYNDDYYLGHLKMILEDKEVE